MLTWKRKEAISSPELWVFCLLVYFYYLPSWLKESLLPGWKGAVWLWCLKYPLTSTGFLSLCSASCSAGFCFEMLSNSYPSPRAKKKTHDIIISWIFFFHKLSLKFWDLALSHLLHQLTDSRRRSTRPSCPRPHRREDSEEKETLMPPSLPTSTLYFVLTEGVEEWGQGAPSAWNLISQAKQWAWLFYMN